MKKIIRRIFLSTSIAALTASVIATPVLLAKNYSENNSQIPNSDLFAQNHQYATNNSYGDRSLNYLDQEANDTQFKADLMTKKQMKTAEVDFDDETVASTDKKYGATIVSASADASLDYLDASTLDNVEDNGFHKGEFNQDLKKEGVSVNWLDSKLSRYNQSDIKNLNPNPKKNNTNNLTKIDSNILSAENEEQKLENEINNSNKEIDQNQDIIASAKNVISILKKQKSVIKAEENDLFHSPVFEPFFSLYYKNNPNSELAFLLIQVTIHLVHF